MKTLYRVGFCLKGKLHADLAYNKVAALCREWLISKRRIKASDGLLLSAESFDHTSPSGVVINALRVDLRDESVWGLRLQHPDAKDKDIVWQTEVTVKVSGNEPPFFGCTMSVGSNDEAVMPMCYEASRPAIVTSMLSEIGGLSGGFPLLTQGVVFTDKADEVRLLIAGLETPKRKHPLVFVSLEHATNHPMIDVSGLADQLAGLAVVVQPESLSAQARLLTKIPLALQAADGAVAIYWPGFNLKHRSQRHVFWSRERIVGCLIKNRQDFARKVLAHIADVALSRADSRQASWSDIERIAKRLALEKAKEAGKEAEYASALWEDNDKLTSKVKELETLLADQDKEVAKYKALADGYKAALDAERIARDGVKEGEKPPESVPEVVERVETKYTDRIVFAFNSKSEHDDSIFEEPEELMATFDWLGSVYYNAKLGRKSCSSLDRSLRETVPGWSYTPHQSDITIGCWREWYECVHKGQKVQITEHMRRGAGTDPRATIRVAFAWSPAEKKIVVGYIGQHQKNTHS